MINFEFPEARFTTEQRQAGTFILDPVRRRWIKITPEEWVRQNLIAYLNKTLGIPHTLMAVEKKLQVGELARRFDLVVYSRNGKPWLLVECKAMDVPLNTATISQMLSYVSALKLPYFFISNGNATYGWQVLNGQVSELYSFPEYQ